ncbi:MAG: phosphonate C-P lyase system protein PhnH [Actinobacteria bacterium 13_2_20CM_2_71_6]|nr:MAG: phosphonate C-P lyase system protein PhnH [Actinobacteria bacterium 13_2_20CM_2_71_6]
MFGPLDTQRCFRSLLRAMSEPGTVHSVTPGLALVLATLVDHEVTLAEVGDPRWDRADFVLIRGGDSYGELIRARHGTLLDPALGATAIYEIDAVGTGPLALSLAGPGVGPRPRQLRLAGVPGKEVALWQVSRSGAPRGVDVILVDRAGRCAALPRSTALERVA